MNPETIKMLYDYTYWAHAKVWDCAMALTEEQFKRQLNYSWGTVHAQLVHVMSAEWMWLSRLRGTSPTSMFLTEEYPTPDAIRARWDEIENDVRAYVDTLTPEALRSSFDYQTSSGKPQTHIRGHILLHVVNHGTDHRAQILAMIHELGGETIEQDLIFYLRAMG